MNVGKQATVRGPVMDGNYAKTSNGQPTFIDVGKSYPASGRFQVLIWGSDRGKFPGSPESTYKGKTICVTGLIESYQGSPEIVVNSPNAIAVQYNFCWFSARHSWLVSPCRPCCGQSCRQATNPRSWFE